MSNDIEQLCPALEAVLFATSEPVPKDELTRVLGVTESVLTETLAHLGQEYADSRRGFILDYAGGGVRLVSKPEYAELVAELWRPVRNSGLSQAAMETLAIVAYKQPITRIEVEAVRGVRAESALNSLLERDLVAETGRKDAPGRPILYGTTPRFLVAFGLNDITELPPLDETAPGQTKLSFSTESAQSPSEE